MIFKISIKVKQLIAKLDIECQKILHKDMRPVEVALLVMLHQKHSDEITFNSVQKRWTWDEKSLRSEYNNRLKDLNLNVSCTYIFFILITLIKEMPLKISFCLHVIFLYCVLNITYYSQQFRLWSMQYIWFIVTRYFLNNNWCLVGTSFYTPFYYLNTCTYYRRGNITVLLISIWHREYWAVYSPSSCRPPLQVLLIDVGTSRA